MSNIVINVEFLAGTALERAIGEAADLALKTEAAYVCFIFNGVKFIVGCCPTTEAREKAIKEYHEHRKYIICN